MSGNRGGVERCFDFGLALYQRSRYRSQPQRRFSPIRLTSAPKRSKPTARPFMFGWAARGPLVLLHGYGGTGDIWAPLAAELARDHTVVAPDLRGMGLSSRPESGYDKKTQARDIAGVLNALGIEKAD